MERLVQLMKVLADESRLRLVRLLARQSLNVGELVAILGLKQPAVSQKLGELRRAGLVRERRAGGYSYYELEPPGGEGAAALASLLGELEHGPDDSGDLARLGEVLREREDRGDGPSRLVEPGRSWVAWSRAQALLLPALRVADLGSGDGALSVEIARWARAVVGVERDRRLVARARERARRAGLRHLRFLAEDIARLSLSDRSQDVAIVSHTLHHADEPAAILAQAARILVPGGRVVVLELAPHVQQWVREKLGHRWLGFAPQALDKLLAGAGFTSISVEPVAQRPAGEPFRILLANGVRP